MQRYYVYILASKSRVLYIGITNNLWRRVWEHKNDALPGFTSKYRVHRLVYYETFKYVGNAIAREKCLKGWLREKKVALIRSANPTWKILASNGSRGRTFEGSDLMRAQAKSRSFAALRMTSLARRASALLPQSCRFQSLRQFARNPGTSPGPSPSWGTPRG